MNPYLDPTPSHAAARTMNAATERVIRAIAAHFFLTFEEVTSTSREKRIALARQISIYVLREHQLPKPSFPELGRQFDKDHTTIMSAVHRVEKLADHDLDGAVIAAIEVGRQALEAATEDQGRMLTLAKCQRRNELLRQIKLLDDEAGFDPEFASVVGAAE